MEKYGQKLLFYIQVSRINKESCQQMIFKMDDLKDRNEGLFSHDKINVLILKEVGSITHLGLNATQDTFSFLDL